MRCDHETMQTPIACALGSEEARHRVEEWRQFFERSIDAAELVGSERLSVRLKPLPETLTAAVDLALREKSCCNFFDFSIDLQLDGCWLVIAVPPDAASVLVDFSQLAPPGMLTEDRGR
jgi:hypothetical protein